jgi:hypothetical protein
MKTFGPFFSITEKGLFNIKTPFPKGRFCMDQRQKYLSQTYSFYEPFIPPLIEQAYNIADHPRLRKSCTAQLGKLFRNSI